MKQKALALLCLCVSLAYTLDLNASLPRIDDTNADLILEYLPEVKYSPEVRKDTEIALKAIEELRIIEQQRLIFTYNNGYSNLTVYLDWLDMIYHFAEAIGVHKDYVRATNQTFLYTVRKKISCRDEYEFPHELLEEIDARETYLINYMHKYDPYRLYRDNIAISPSFL